MVKINVDKYTVFVKLTQERNKFETKLFLISVFSVGLMCLKFF